MKLKASEISKIIEEQIENFDSQITVQEEGTILSIGDGIVRAYGLDGIMAGELVRFEDGTSGMALNLEEDNVGIVLLDKGENLREGDSVTCTGKILEVPAGQELLGRVVNPLGKELDGKGAIETGTYRRLEMIAPGIVHRETVSEPLLTGLKAIDSMVPIGRGQRELIIGDRQTGKTAVALDAIIAQKDTDTICIYVAIGQKNSTIAQVTQKLAEEGAMDYTLLVVASASDTASLQYIAPFAGVAMAEQFLYEGKSVLIIYDDLSKQAVAYRELSLLLRRPPGREAYPGDIFYLHSRLLERACKLSKQQGSGSITALPIIETQAGDISAYIPTNVISITDGQIFLETELFNSGVRPAINVGTSVSRVGGAAQDKAMKQVAGTLRLDLAQYREKVAFMQFGSDLDEVTQKQLSRGSKLVEILKQKQYAPMKMEEQVIALFAITKGFADDLALDRIGQYEQELLAHMKSQESALLQQIAEERALSDSIIANLDKVITSFTTQFNS